MATQVNATGTNVDLHIRRGRTNTFTITVTGISDWTDIAATFYYSKKQSDEDAEEIECTITEAENAVTLEFAPEDTEELSGLFYYDLMLHKTEWQKDLMYGKLQVGDVVKAVIV